MPVVQTLDARYIDGAALLRLLKQLFGTGNFRIDVGFAPFIGWKKPANRVPSLACGRCLHIDHSDQTYKSEYEMSQIAQPWRKTIAFDDEE